ncbi:MAG TPA: DUF1254 domain-containing protein [Candidatus Acidoferrales bacterium]|nr:DUF1254 domain-containing protein [Candidatus Acidoferrales bacterium]
MTGYQHLLLFGAVAAAACFAFIYSWPRLMLTLYKRAILSKGFGEGPIPINTLYQEPQAVFADPLRAAPSSGSNLITTGVNRDTLYTVGWLDLKNGPQVLHVPDMAGRYYSVQLTDPSNDTNFAYVGKRVTGTAAGDFVICGPGWTGAVPQGMTRISSPTNSVLVAGRTLVENEADLPAAYALSAQIRLSPLDR